MSAPPSSTRAQRIAQEDLAAAGLPGRRFTHGTRPVIRWIKGDGLDDDVTRAAIAQATRLFGTAVDYCLVTEGIAAPRARNILAWADQAVEWWPVRAEDNQPLASHLVRAGCRPEHFGYWWKWFPDRVRPAGPEWILDGDMVITGQPDWFRAWREGRDVPRLAQDNRSPLAEIHGRYADLVDPVTRFYSGLASLPPGLSPTQAFASVLMQRPLAHPHDGKTDMCEQGVVATAFHALGAQPIPLHEFPFGRAFEDFVDFGLEGDQGRVWGYHFGNAFRRANPHFERLSAAGVIFAQPSDDPYACFKWLGGEGPWGIPGWTTPYAHARNIANRARAWTGRRVLELGTSRGKLSAMLASVGCRVITVDHTDRGARQNLAGLDVECVIAEAEAFMSQTDLRFDLIICDVHGNSPAEWQRFAAPLRRCLAPRGNLILNNAGLSQVDDWQEETGVTWFLAQLPPRWEYTLDNSTAPGLAVVRAP
jgi:hypothetical protein